MDRWMAIVDVSHTGANNIAAYITTMLQRPQVAQSGQLAPYKVSTSRGVSGKRTSSLPALVLALPFAFSLVCIFVHFLKEFSNNRQPWIRIMTE